MNVYGEISGTLTPGAAISGVLNSGASISGVLSAEAAISGTLTPGGSISGTLSSAETIEGSVRVTSAITPPTYEGPTEITPSSEAQILDTAYFYMLEDITINAIPNNYGLITWNGSVLTVS